MKKADNSKIPRLFALMAKKEVKAVKLGADLGVSTGNISDWKSGKSLPSAGTLSAIADYLGTTPEYLRGETDDPSPAKSRENSGVSARNANNDDTVPLTEQEKLIVKIFRNASLEDKFRMITAMMTIANKTPGAIPGTSLAAFGGGSSAEPPIDDIVIT